MKQSLKCDICNTNKAHGTANKESKIKFAFGSKYDYDVYQLNLESFPELKDKYFDCCDACFDEKFKESSILLHTLMTTSFASEPWWIDGINGVECIYEVDDDYEIEDMQINTNINNVDVKLQVLNFNVTDNPYGIVLNNTVNNTSEPIGMLYLKTDVEDIFLIPRSERILTDSCWNKKIFTDLHGYYQYTLLWVNKNGNLTHQKPTELYVFDGAQCLYKNDIYTLIINNDKYYVQDFHGNISEVDDINNIICSFQTKY